MNTKKMPMVATLAEEVARWDRKSLFTLVIATSKRLWPNGRCTKREASRLANLVQAHAYMLKPPPQCPECKKRGLDTAPEFGRWTCSKCGASFFGNPVELKFQFKA